MNESEPARRRVVTLVAACLTAVVSIHACGGDASPAGPGPGTEPPDEPIAIPARGTAGTFDVGTWNIQFFGAPDEGPADDLTQLRRVRDVVLGTDLDVWGVQEISDAADFAALLGQLPGYAGLLADDPSVANGAAHYADTGADELKVGLIYKPDLVQVLDARVVLTDLDFEFAGRPPLELRVRVSVGGVAQEVILLVLHAKADAEVASWERRAAAADGLKSHLDGSWRDEPVLVVGDWNDDVDQSISPGLDTPYRSLVDAAPEWVFVTAPLTAAGETSILGFDDMIDHILASDESAAWHEPGSSEVYRVDGFIPGYRDNTSDHLPVVARFRVTTGG